jgi:hypothetical protein
MSQPRVQTLGEIPYLPAEYLCPAAEDHAPGACPKCQPIRPAAKSDRMKTLTDLQHAVLEAVRETPGAIIDREFALRVKDFANRFVGPVDEVRVAVAAGQLEARGLLSYMRYRQLPSRLEWSITETGLTYLD